MATNDCLPWSEQPNLPLVVRIERLLLLNGLGGPSHLHARTNISTGPQQDRKHDRSGRERFATECVRRRHATSDLSMAGWWLEHPGGHKRFAVADQRPGC